jgi:phospholipid transport system substrate-binding protein
MFFQIREGRYSALLAFFVLLFATPQWTMAVASGPMSVIQAGTERVLQILRSSQRGGSSSLSQRKSEVLAIVDEYFNFEEMGKRALGRPWKDQSPANRQEFTRLFKQLLFDTYFNKVRKYTGQNEKAYYDSQKLEGDYALVKTHIQLQGNENLSLDYRLHQENGQWKVYDVVIEGISLVENYRAQFASILASGSFDALLRKLRDKIQQQA